jgi:hypothetical protein
MKSVRRSDLITHLIGADVRLDEHETLHRAVLHWYGHLAERRSVCIGCGAEFASDDLRVGAFLLAQPIDAPSTVVTSAFCQCIEALTADEVDVAATRLLRQICPQGRFRP